MFAVRQAVPGRDRRWAATAQITFSVLIALQTLFSPAQVLGARPRRRAMA